MTSLPVVSTVRRWAVDWLNGHDAAVCDEIMTHDYELRIGEFTFTDRASYLAATSGQIALYDGLAVTVHDLVTDGRRVAVHLTEHGASTENGGAFAVWNVVSLFEFSEDRICRTYAEEDYHARRRQFGDAPDAMSAPMSEPWSTAAAHPDDAATAVVTAWFEGGAVDLDAVVRDDQDVVSAYDEVMDRESGSLDIAFAAGDRVAFHGTFRGRSRPDGVACAMAAAGIVEVSGGSVVAGRMVTDRLGCLRAVRRVTR